jgi:hypothetical protein
MDIIRNVGSRVIRKGAQLFRISEELLNPNQQTRLNDRRQQNRQQQGEHHEKT